MSTNKTKNLNLHAWEPSDPFRRVEFNENFAAIDTAYATLRTLALSSQMRVEVGSYKGDGTSGESYTSGLYLSFTPKLIFLWAPGFFAVLAQGASTATSLYYAAENNYRGAQFGTLSLTWGGSYAVQWYTSQPVAGTTYAPNSQGNVNNVTYYYAAIG